MKTKISWYVFCEILNNRIVLILHILYNNVICKCMFTHALSINEWESLSWQHFKIFTNDSSQIYNLLCQFGIIKTANLFSPFRKKCITSQVLLFIGYICTWKEEFGLWYFYFKPFSGKISKKLSIFPFYYFFFNETGFHQYTFSTPQAQKECKILRSQV